MEQHCFVAMGSNMGERMQTLLQAMEQIDGVLGRIRQISPPYETAAWGFEAPPFINACLQLETDHSPEELLFKLQAIEKQFGRTPSSSKEYESRTLDLDLIFYGNQRRDNQSLQLPHPRMHARHFVLKPMLDLAPDFQHPSLKLSLQELHNDCKDTTPINVLPFQSWLPSLFESLTYLAIAGNIGSGKTTLTRRLAEDYPVKVILESFDKNPHLAAFYQNPEEYALKTEQYFLQSRIEQLSTPLLTPCVSDFWLEKSLLFAQATLSQSRFSEFQKSFISRSSQAVSPDAVVYLYRPVSELLLHIKKRGRVYEQNISSTYLEAITASYERKLEEVFSYPILKVDATGQHWGCQSYDYVKFLWELARL